jgi:serine/threonine-protein kinase
LASLIGKSIGNYRVESLIGEGGMGAVYLAVHPQIGKRVAVKVLREELAADQVVVDRFFHEAKAVNDISHPNVIDIVDFGRVAIDAKDVVYLIMEYLDGESLAARLRRGLQPYQISHVLRQCCAALAASHGAGVVHRDLKPDNIFVCRRAEDDLFVKVLDFGIAKVEKGLGNKTRTGMVLGTPAYMSPEQCAGRGQIDHRSDVYSLGIVMYEMLTGRVPFDAEGFGEVVVQHLTQMPMPPSAIRPVSPQLESIIMRALEKDPARRFQSMAEFEAALRSPDAHYGGAPLVAAARSNAATMVNTGKGGPRVTTLSGAASETMSRPRSPSGRGGLWAVAVLLVAGLGVGGYFLLSKPGSEPVAAAPAPEPAPAPAPATPPKPAEPQTVRIQFESTPSGAKVTRPDGELLGTTPFSKSFERGSAAMDVAFALPGHARQTRTVETDASRLIDVSLARESAAAARAPAAEPEPTPTKKGGAAAAHASTSKKSTPKGKSSTKSSAPHDPGGLIKTIFDK